MPWFQSWPELEKKLQMKYIFGRQKKKDKCTQWFKNNSKGGFVAPFFFWKNAVIKGGFMSEDTGGFFHCQNKYSESLS